ncbi:MAG: immunity 42 family protein, partial [Oscillospiraceae bacterium]|nr:immunity 42 family protein [Oscillospiraceae bacterium]
MLFGDPEKFAFLIEKVPEWSDESFANGLLYVCINWEMFPKDLRNTTLSDDLQFLLDKEHPYGMFCLVNDEKLYALSDKELFAELRLLRFPMYFTENEDADGDDDYCLDLDVDDDYRFDLDLVELGDCHYHLFAVS